MTDQAETTAPADEMADEGMTDEDQLWDEMDAEEGQAAEDNPDAADADEGSDFSDADDPADFEADGTEDHSQGDAAAPEDAPSGSETTGEEAEEATETIQTPTLEELQATSKRHEQMFKSEQARSVAQQKRADRLQKELDAIKGRQQQADDNSADDTGDRLNAVKEEYGDVVGPLVDEVNNLKGRLNDQASTDQHRAETISDELQGMQAEEVAKFETEHPDGMDVVSNNAAVFKEWIEDQPKIVRDAFAANQERFVDGTGAALVVSRFKAALAEAGQGDTPKPTDTKLEARRSRQLAGAKSTRKTTPQKASARLPDDADPDALWDEFDRFDARSG